MKVMINVEAMTETPEDQRLTPRRLYEVIGIAADFIRIIDDEAEPVLFPCEWFIVVDASEPADWVTSYGEEGERYAYPPELGGVGFFEDWHDGVESARQTFRDFLTRRGLGEYGNKV